MINRSTDSLVWHEYAIPQETLNQFKLVIRRYLGVDFALSFGSYDKLRLSSGRRLANVINRSVEEVQSGSNVVDAELNTPAED
jgi:hypothetical protein